LAIAFFSLSMSVCESAIRISPRSRRAIAWQADRSDFSARLRSAIAACGLVRIHAGAAARGVNSEASDSSGGSRARPRARPIAPAWSIDAEIFGQRDIADPAIVKMVLADLDPALGDGAAANLTSSSCSAVSCLK
jgi:hypothetical protein